MSPEERAARLAPPYEELELLPPAHSTITLKVDLIGPMAMANVSVEVTHGLMDEHLVALWVRPVVNLSDTQRVAIAAFIEHLSSELYNLSPF